MFKHILILTSIMIGLSSRATDFNFSGSLRYRHDSSKRKGDAQTRHQHRIQAKLQGTANIDEDSRVVLGLATGTAATSRNATLDGAFGLQSVGFDLAYAQFDFMQDDLVFSAGKVLNPFHRTSDLIWDSDLTPEGLALQWKSLVNVNAGAFWAEERATANDTFLYGIDFNKGFEFGAVTFTPGLGYFTYSNIKGQTVLGSSALESNGNSAALNTAGTLRTYMYEYNIFNVGFELGFDVGLPVTLFADYVTNTASNVTEGNAWSLGAQVGKAKGWGTWSIMALYRSLEKDAVVGAFTDGDFNGGGTNSDGFKANITLGLSDAATLGLTAYLANDFQLADSRGTVGKDYNKYQADLNVKF